MLEELMNMVRQFGHSTVVENPAVPNEHNEDVLKEAGSSIFSGLQQSAENGDTDAITGMLQGDANHPAVARVQQSFAEKISQKFGIDGSAAKGLAAGLIPSVLRSLLKRPGQGSGSGLSLQSIISSLTGGGANAGAQQHPGMLSTLGAKLGLDRDGDGDVDIADLTGMMHR